MIRYGDERTELDQWDAPLCREVAAEVVKDWLLWGQSSGQIDRSRLGRPKTTPRERNQPHQIPNGGDTIRVNARKEKQGAVNAQQQAERPCSYCKPGLGIAGLSRMESPSRS